MYTKIIAELLNTERSYTNCLSDVVHIYLASMKGFSISKQKTVSTEKIHDIFMNVEAILNVHQILMRELESHTNIYEDINALAMIFLNVLPALQIYTAYVSNYDMSISTLGSLKNNKGFIQLLEKCQKETIFSKGLQLDSLLIMPIQRIARYVLLLQQLMSHITPDQQGYTTLCTVLEKYKDFINQVNESKRKVDNMITLNEIQHKIEGDFINLVEPNRFFVKEGQLQMQIVVYKDTTKNSKNITSKSQYQIYYFFLFSDCFVFCSIIQTSKYKFEGIIDLKRSKLYDIPADNRNFQESVFEITMPESKAYLIRAENEDQKAEWMKIITQTIHLCKEKNSKLQEKLSLDNFKTPAKQDIEKAGNPVGKPSLFNSIRKKKYSHKNLFDLFRKSTDENEEDTYNSNESSFKSLRKKSRKVSFDIEEAGTITDNTNQTQNVWSSGVHEDGKKYYYNSETGAYVWELFDDNGLKYFYNSLTKQSTWEFPHDESTSS